MAKFKKKKSEPTLGKDESTEEKPLENTDIKPEKKEISSKKQDIPPTEPVINESESAEYKKKLDKLFWLRVGLAVVGGITATFLFDSIEGEERRWTSIGFMIIIFIVSIGIAKGMKIQLPSSDRKKIVTQGIGSYIFLYLFIWIVSYTIVNMTGSESGITSPLP